MTNQLSPRTQSQVKRISKLLKIKEETLVDRAIQYYIFVLDKGLESQEFDMWDSLSDEALYSFEQKYL